MLIICMWLFEYSWSHDWRNGRRISQKRNCNNEFDQSIYKQGLTLSILSNCGLNIFQQILLSKNYFFVIGNIFLIGSPHFNWTCRATFSESNILTEHANDMNITNATNLIAIIWFWSVDFVFWRKSRHAEKPTDNDITRESEWNAEIFVKL